MATASSASASRAAILSLYRNLLKTGNQFSQYSFRQYARRKTRDAFREYKHETDPQRIQELVSRGISELRMMKRQTTISQMYCMDKLVVEGGIAGEQIGNKRDRMRLQDRQGRDQT